LAVFEVKNQLFPKKFSTLQNINFRLKRQNIDNLSHQFTETDDKNAQSHTEPSNSGSPSFAYVLLGAFFHKNEFSIRINRPSGMKQTYPQRDDQPFKFVTLQNITRPIRDTIERIIADASPGSMIRQMQFLETIK
jgi:hypothetical protein